MTIFFYLYLYLFTLPDDAENVVDCLK